MTLAIGLILGAWVMTREDWPTVFLCALVSLAMSVIDRFYGYEIGVMLDRVLY